MIKPSEITIVLPIFNLKDNRLKNFYKVIESLSETEIRVLVLEQLKTGSKSEIVHSYSNINMLECFNDSDLINKSKLVNYAVNISDTKYIWQIDADILLKWDYILSKVTDEDVVRPFDSVVKLTEEETVAYYRDGSINIKKGEQREVISCFGPMSFIIKRDLFLKEGGMCEKFEGWGWEDLDFARKIKSKYKVVVAEKSFGIHLWHTYTETKSVEEKVNRNIYRNSGIDIIPLNFDAGFKPIKNDDAKIIHITSYYLKFNDSDRRQFLAHTSISKYIPNNSRLINLSFNGEFSMPNSLNITYKDNKPFLDDMLNVAFSYCDNDDDIIVFTNSDCIIDSKFYDNIKANVENVCLLIRRDIGCTNNENIEDLYTMDHNLSLWGIDGIALTKSKYLLIKDKIPHMKVAEPFWDNTFHTILLNENINFTNLYGILYHIEHDRSWESTEDCHNVRYKNDNFKEIITKNTLKTNPPTISIICCSFMQNYDPLVYKSQLVFLKNIRYQNIPHEVIFVEMGFNDKFYFNNVGIYGEETGNRYKHIKINGTSENDNIFHKEALWNIGKSHASTKFLFFCDADVTCEDTNWLNEILNTLKGNEGVVLQPFSSIKDSLDNNIKYVSAASYLIDKNCFYPKRNPGIGWAMSSDTFNEINGFNPLCVFGDGDTCFLEEIVEPRYLPDEQKVLSRCNRLYVSLHIERKNTNKKRIMYLKNIILSHIYHGPVSNRKYVERNYIFLYIKEKLKKELMDYVEVGPVVKWKNLENEALWLITQKSNIPLDEKSAFSFFDTIIYENIQRVCAGNLNLINIQPSTSVKFSVFCSGINIKFTKEQLPLEKLDASIYLKAEVSDTAKDGHLLIPLNKWDSFDLTRFNHLITRFISDSPCFYSFYGPTQHTKEMPLNQINDIRHIRGEFRHAIIRFKGKLHLNLFSLSENRLR